jgi:Membrane bound O-acyl transferase family
MNATNSVVHDLFNKKFDFDDREPSILISLPAIGTLGVKTFIPMFWLQSVLCFLLGSLINAVIAFFIFTFLVKRKGTTEGYLIGYGFVVPLLIFLPWFIIRLLDLQNIAILLSVAASFPSLSLLRCVEAIHGTLPEFAGSSLQNFVLYFSATLGFQFNFDTKSRTVMKLTRRELLGKILSFGRLFLESTFYLSVMLPREFAIFPRKDYVESAFDLVRHMVNNLFLAFLFATSMETGSKGVSLVASLLTGYSTTEMSDRPLTASTSFAEFWGRRWNRIMAGGLRRGIFQPARQAGCPRIVAALITFVASGLFHEYLLLIMTWRGGLPNNPYNKTYIPKFGYQTTFFAWNGLLLVVESLLQHTAPIVWIRANLPKPMLTALVLVSVLPVGHFFIDEYVASGFFSDQAWGYPQVVWLGAAAATSGPSLPMFQFQV